MTEINREALLASLKKIRPALAEKSPLQQLLHIWADEKTITAYNDVIGIEVPVSLGFEGGVLGAALAGVVEASSAENAVFSLAKKTAVSLKLGSANITLPLLPSDQRVIKLPSVPKAIVVDVTEQVKKGLALVMLSTEGVEKFRNAHILAVLDDESFSFYGTDDLTLSWAIIDMKNKKTGNYALSIAFCANLLSMWSEGAKLYFMEDAAMAVFADGSKLLGRFVSLEMNVDYAGMIASSLPTEDGASIPADFKQAMNKVIVLNNNPKSAAMRLSYNKKKLMVAAQGDFGAVEETFVLDAACGKDGANTPFAPVLMLRGPDYANKFAFNERCFVLLCDRLGGYMVAAVAL